MTVTSGTETVATGLVILTTLAPSLFTLNSSNLAAAYAACVSSSGAITTETPFQAVNGAIEAQALNLGACSQTILELYGTGLDYATASGTQVMFGEVAGMVQYAGPGGGFPGLDQINVVIPQSDHGQYGRHDLEHRERHYSVEPHWMAMVASLRDDAEPMATTSGTAPPVGALAGMRMFTCTSPQ